MPDFVQDAIVDYASAEHPKPEDPINESVIVEPTDADPSDDVFSIGQPFEVTCPACNGRHRAHGKDAGCRLGKRPTVRFNPNLDPFGDDAEPIASEDVGGSGPEDDSTTTVETFQFSGVSWTPSQTCL